MPAITQINNLRLNVKLPLIFGIVVVLMIAVVGVLIYVGVQELVSEAGSDRIAEETALMEARIVEAQEQLLNDAKRISQIPALRDAVQQDNITDIHSTLLLSSTLDTIKVDRILIVDLDGRSLAEIVDRKVVSDVPPQQNTLISLGLLGIDALGVLEAETPLLVGVSPIITESGELIGAVQAARRIDDRFLRSINHARSSVHLVYIRHGDISAVYIDELYHLPGEVQSLLRSESGPLSLTPSEQLKTYGITLDQPSLDKAQRGENVFPDAFVRNADDELFAVAYFPLVIDFEIEGVMAIFVDLQTLNSFRDALMTRQVIALLLLGMVYASILAFLARHLITIPLERLQLAANRLANGEFPRYTDIQSKDEVGQLAVAFNSMAETLRERNEAIEAEMLERTRAEKALWRAKDELEQRVKERTGELQTVNERLANELDQRIQAEQRIRETLQEKEVLLREIHHRVKNNLQVISSLLRLQASYANEEHTAEILQESQHRVQSMALVHERLYQSPDLARISVVEYVNDLAHQLQNLYRTATRPVNLMVKVDDLAIDVDTAIPCGLILNELISNAFKHAFPDGRCGVIQVEVRGTNDRLCSMEVQDNGVGFPHDLTIENASTLGLQLVMSLSTQLGGSIILGRNSGTTVRLTFHQ